MYVIFPADELIRMTYGIAIPRFKPRPTLDNLREPAVPFGPRPRSPTDRNALTSKPPPSAAPKKPPFEPTLPPHLPPSSRSTPPLRASTPLRSATPIRSTTPVRSGSIARSERGRLSVTIPPPSPTRVHQTTDAFGYASTHIDEGHPNIFLEPPTPSALSEASTAPLSSHGRLSPSSPIPPVKSKHKLHLHLGRLGRSKASAKPEPSRLRDVTDIRISNPTFTRENLRQRNYDAFFESGEPVYSLEQRSPHADVVEEPELVAEPRPRSLGGIFHRKPKAATASPDIQSRSRSVDRNTGSEMADKATPPTKKSTNTQITPETDEFGYASTHPSSDKENPETECDESATPASITLTEDDLYSGPYFPKAKNRPPGSSPSSPSTTSAAAAKPKRKLHLHLGRLGRSATKKPEPARLRDVTDIRIINPTFTRENLQQRNYDAFFESGVPVYSLERRATPVDLPDPEPRVGFFRKGNTMFGGGGGGAGGAAMRSKGTDEMVDGSQKATVKSTERRFFGWRGARGGSLGPPAAVTMATPLGILRDCTHPTLNETLKTHNSVTFKLVETVSNFTAELAELYQQHAESLKFLCSRYQKSNAELRKERPACPSTLFQAWETFLQEVDADSVAAQDASKALQEQVSRPLINKSHFMKLQSRRVFENRDTFDSLIAKTEEKLKTSRANYKHHYTVHRQNPTQITLTKYLDAHNAYVQQLHATNGMMENYHMDVMPQVTKELEEIYKDMCIIVADGLLLGSDIISRNAIEQTKRFDTLSTQCRNVSSTQDLNSFLRYMQPESPPKVPRKVYAPPDAEVADNQEQTPVPLRNELIMERNSSIQVRSSVDELKQQAFDIEKQIRQIQATIDTMVRYQLQDIESQLYDDVNSTQGKISEMKCNIRVHQMHLAAIKAKKELFRSKGVVEPTSPSSRASAVVVTASSVAASDRKLSVASSPSMKTKWLKAFRSLKPTSGPQPADKRNGSSAQTGRIYESEHHSLQEYTYKKITPCDVCSQVLRGHTRQGLRCRACKQNVHVDCVPKLLRCQPKQKLLRRQKSTSEIDNRADVEEEKPNEIDQIYQVLKQAGAISSHKLSSDRPPVTSLSMNLKAAAAAAMAAKQEQQTNGTTSTMAPGSEIPRLNIPECPERQIRKGASKPPSLGSCQQPTKQSLLVAPATNIVDMSSSAGAADVAGAASHSGTPPLPNRSKMIGASGGPNGGPSMVDTRRKLWAGIRPLSALGWRFRFSSTQHRSISLPETPHSPRRQKLNLRMKSLSLDSPESTELHTQIRKRNPPQGTSAMGYHPSVFEHTPPSNNSRLHSPSSPSAYRKLLSANRNLRTGSVDLPDDMEKSLSSNSTSPCASPVRQGKMQAQPPAPLQPQKTQHRLLPTNLYVILYNFEARHPDELDLKAGYKVTVTDTTDSDWWKAKFLGRIGYFPATYCAKLSAGEKPLQVTQNLQISDTGEGMLTLLRDQIVVQIGDEVSGSVMVRAADNRQGICPVKYLQEV